MHDLFCAQCAVKCYGSAYHGIKNKTVIVNIYLTMLSKKVIVATLSHNIYFLQLWVLSHNSDFSSEWWEINRLWEKFTSTFIFLFRGGNRLTKCTAIEHTEREKNTTSHNATCSIFHFKNDKWTGSIISFDCFSYLLFDSSDWTNWTKFAGLWYITWNMLFWTKPMTRLEYYSMKFNLIFTFGNIRSVKRYIWRT